jgi:peptidoglycan hydrolase CwlO-like protein
MLRKLTVVFILTLVIILTFGCRKKPSSPETPSTQVKSQADYNEMAKSQISPENMQAELDKLEKEIQQESAGGF